MKIITTKGQIDSEKDAIVFVFTDDTELNGFLSKLASSEVKTSGLRILTLMPDRVNLTPIQTALLNIIEGLDGIGGNDEKENDKIIDNSINGINDLIKTS